MSAAALRCCLILAALLAPLPAAAQILTTLYKFTGTADGEAPIGTLVYAYGMLYGAAELGGANGIGIVFSLNPATGALTVLHSFAGGTDGAFPLTLVGRRPRQMPRRLRHDFQIRAMMQTRQGSPGFYPLAARPAGRRRRSGKSFL